MISIHALLAESDARPSAPSPDGKYFDPRSPCGERPARVKVVRFHLDISIHALLAESDTRNGERRPNSRISIHALLAESDLELFPERFCNPLISIHALLAESDQ